MQIQFRSISLAEMEWMTYLKIHDLLDSCTLKRNNGTAQPFWTFHDSVSPHFCFSRKEQSHRVQPAVPNCFAIWAMFNPLHPSDLLAHYDVSSRLVPWTSSIAHVLGSTSHSSLYVSPSISPFLLSISTPLPLPILKTCQPPCCARTRALFQWGISTLSISLIPSPAPWRKGCTMYSTLALFPTTVSDGALGGACGGDDVCQTSLPMAVCLLWSCEWGTPFKRNESG